MKKFSRQLLDVRVKFLLIPGVPISHQSSLSFQGEIRKAGLDYSSVSLPNNAIVMERKELSPLRIGVEMAPQQPFCEFEIAAELPKTGIEAFTRDAEAAVSAFQATWPLPARQIVRCDAAIRELHETEGEHAFKELWEDVLGQSAKSLQIFGKPIRGGGLRFVLDPNASDEDPLAIEVKIESFLNDVRKIYVETVFSWIKPRPPNSAIDVAERITQMDKYIQENVQGFILGAGHGNAQ